MRAHTQVMHDATLPHLFGSTLMTGAFNRFTEPPILYKTMRVLKIHEN